MGLVIDTKGWPVEALVAMATEGISVSYGEVICGGDKSIDRKIGRMLDKGKVLAAVDKLPEHLSSWLLIAYSSSGYVSVAQAENFYDLVFGEFIGRNVSGRIRLCDWKWDSLRQIIPLICHDVARSGHDLKRQIKPAHYIAALASESGIKVSSVRANWVRDWRPAVSVVKNILIGWDLLAQKLFWEVI